MSDQEHSFQEGEEAPPPGVWAMAVVRWFLVLGMGAIAAASLVYVFGNTGRAEEKERAVQYYCPMHPAVVQDHPGECPICGMTLVPREAAHAHDHTAEKTANPAETHAGHRHEPSEPYYCPMHPEETGRDETARCPLCGMKLEKRAPEQTQPERAPSIPARNARKSDISEAAATVTTEVPDLVPVEIPTERIQHIGMRTARVARARLASELRSVGYVTPTETGLAVVQTRFSGWLQELLVSQTGQAVARGELLARIYSPELLAAQQELLNAKRWAGGSASAASVNLLETARNRLELMGVHPEEIQQIEQSGTPHRLVEVRSPARGYVAQKNAVQGLYVQPGTRLFEVADLSKVWVLVDVFERDGGRVRAGQKAELTLTAYPGEVFSGKVQLVYPMVNPETRTLRARLEFKNADLRLRPGMFGDVRLELTSSEGLVVPREAVVDTGEHQYVFVMETGGRFVPRAVRLGERSDDRVQVVAGLQEGETVVTTGNFLIDSESRLRATIEGRTRATDSTGTH